MSGIVSACLLPRWILIAAITLLGLKFLGPKFAALDPDVTKVVDGVRQIDFEMVLPFVIKEFIPVGLVGLLMAGLLAAFMSTFSATLNAGGAYLVNDLYKRYLKPDGSNRHYVAVSYVAQVADSRRRLRVRSHGRVGEPDDAMDRAGPLGRLHGGQRAQVALASAERLRLFLGHAGGHRRGAVRAAVLRPVPASPTFASFGIILALSTLGCVLGSLLTKPEDEEVLKRFYRQVRPWGWWGPVHAAVLKEDPSFKRNTSFGRDMFNCVVAIIWQIPLWVIPVYVIFRSWKALWISIGVLLVTSAILKFNWFDKLEKDEPAKA